jgi:hypothetical protein
VIYIIDNNASYGDPYTDGFEERQILCVEAGSKSGDWFLSEFVPWIRQEKLVPEIIGVADVIVWKEGHGPIAPEALSRVFFGWGEGIPPEYTEE